MINRSAIMKDAWKRYRDAKRLCFDWTFSRCLLVAWQAAKMGQRNPRQRYNPAYEDTRIYRWEFA